MFEGPREMHFPETLSSLAESIVCWGNIAGGGEGLFNFT